MRISGTILASLVISLVLHLLLLFWCANLQFTPPMSQVSRRAPEDDLISIHLLSPLQLQPKLEQKQSEKENRTKDSAAELREQALGENNPFSDKKILDILEKENLTLKAPPPKIQFGGINDASMKNQEIPKPMDAVPAQAPRPKIVQIEMPNVSADAAENRVVIPLVERIDVPDINLPSLLPPGPEITGSSGSVNVGMRLQQPSFQPPEMIPEDLPGGNGLELSGVPLPAMSIAPDMGDIASQPSPFDEFVSVDVAVQDDPSTGGGFFMVTIQANDKSENVAEVPMDTLFIIDHSTSISLSKLEEFKNATSNALEYLNPQDRFNIITFNNQSKKFADNFVPASAHNRDTAKTFISRVTRNGTTDVFGGLHPFVKESNGNPDRPLNIYLLTDGISTVNIYKKEDFLHQISGINPGNVSIHTFSAGKEANRELLDYLAFLNRGYSEHAPAVKNINSQLTSFIASLGHLLIFDMKYIAPAVLADEIYPKQMPHLYRNAPLRLFGKFAPADKNLVLTILGRDARGIRRDLIFTCEFEKCERTGDDLARLWAARKIFQLLTDKVLCQDPAKKRQLEQEIKSLKSKFAIAVPYN